MADDFPPHYAVSVTATSDGSGPGRVHRDSIFNMVSSANQNNQIRLPDAFIGKRVEGYVGDNGVTLAASRPLNQDTTYQVPPNYYFEAVQTPEGWNVELVDNLGQGGGASQYASYAAPIGFRWDFVTLNGARVTQSNEPVVVLVRAA